MAIYRKPVIGTWYMNPAGKIIKVFATSYQGNTLSHVVIEFLNGKKRVIDIKDWLLLDLETDFTKIYRKAKDEKSSK